MAQMIELPPTSRINQEDLVHLWQEGLDKKIKLSLAYILLWAKRNNYTYIGEHTNGVEFLDYRSFTHYEGKTFFLLSSVPTPYISLEFNPEFDTNLYAKRELSDGTEGDMNASIYDPQDIRSDSFDRSNHTGVQPINSISGLSDELSKLTPDKKIDEATGIITRVKNVTERVITTVTAVTYTLDMSAFVAGDEFIVIPTVDAPDITLIVDEDLFEMPDGTTGTTITLTTFATARFVKSSSNFKLRAN